MGYGIAFVSVLTASVILSGCVGGGSTTGSTTILKGVDVNDGRPGTYDGYNYVPMVFKSPERNKKR